MNTPEIIQFVQQVGFPIACTVALFYLLYNEMQQRRKDAEERAVRDAEFTRVIAENTAATQSLKELVKSFHGGGNA